MKQSTAKNFFKEHRFVFQQNKGKKAAPPTKPTGEKSPEIKPGETPTTPSPTPATPEAPAAAKAAGEGQVEGTGTVKRAAVIDRVKFNEEVQKNVTKFFELIKIPNKSFELRDTVSFLNEADLATMTQKIITELKPLLAEKIKGREADLQTYLDTLGGDKDQFIELAVTIQAGSFTQKMKNLLADPTYKYLKEFIVKPENKDQVLVYTTQFNTNGVATEIKLGPPEFIDAYAKFHVEKTNAETPAQKAADVIKAENDLKERTAKITTLKSYPILKFLSPFLGLDTIDAATGKSGWDSVADGTHTLALVALDFFGYPDGQGSIEGIASFLPGQTGAKIKAAQKTLSSEKNSLSAAAYFKKTGDKPGAPAAPGAPQAPNTPSKPVKPGEVPTTHQEKVDMTKFGDIIAKPALMPKTGIVFENAVSTGTGGIPDKLEINLNAGGRLILPGNSGSGNGELKIDGEKVIVPPGETRTFTSSSGKHKNGIFTLEGLINEGTVIDGTVKITDAAIDKAK